MITVTNLELINAWPVLKELTGKRSSDLDYRAARAIGTRVIKAVSERLQEYEKIRVEMVKKFGSETEVEDQYQVLPEHETEYYEYLKTLQAETVELVNVNKLPAGYFAEANLTGMEWAAIDWLVED